MTNRISSFLVVLDEDISEEEANQVLAVLRMLKGVISVTPNVVDVQDMVARERVRISITRDVEMALENLWRTS